MSVQNMQPGAIIDVAEGMIQGKAYLYRTGQGYDSPGEVGWFPTGGVPQTQELPVGHTATFAINGNAGTLANGCPSMVQLLYDNSVPSDQLPSKPHGARGLFAAKTANKPVAGTQLSAVGASDSDNMGTLTAQWYNAVVTGLGLSSSNFQLIQGNLALGSLSEFLWNVFDSVPPASVNQLFNPSQFNSFSQDYGAVINNLVPQNSNSFQSIMGDYYSKWMTYLGGLTSVPSGGILAAFQQWSQLHMPPTQAQSAYTAYQQISQGVVPVAVQMWIQAGGAPAQKAYTTTIEQVTTALQGVAGKSFSMNNSTESSDISQTWCEGEIFGLVDFFEGGGESSYSSYSAAMFQAGISISATFTHQASVNAGPLNQASTDPILSGYTPWYYSPALNLALTEDNNTVWMHTPPTWDDTFGPSGNLLRSVSGLVIVDGVTITITSNVQFNSQQQQAVQAASESGFFPFYESEVAGGWQNDITFDSNGNMTMTSSSPTGNPIVLGVLVSPISAVANL